MGAGARQVGGQRTGAHRDGCTPPGGTVRRGQGGDGVDHVGRYGLGPAQLRRQPQSEDTAGPERGHEVVGEPPGRLDGGRLSGDGPGHPLSGGDDVGPDRHFGHRSATLASGATTR